MELPEIKTRLDILTVLGRYKLQPDRHDMLVCPFHQDKKAQHEGLSRYQYLFLF